MTDRGAVKIKGQIQAYQWGGLQFLPQLLGYSNTNNLPQAEYWLGAHPSACATAADTDVPLDQLLRQANAPSLQFLLKILDVHDMLSIQVHPTKEQAAAGFARENALGISLNAKNRNYKDVSDKPELMVALSEFWLLHGFRREDEIASLLESKPYLDELRKKLLRDGLKAAFAFALDFSSEKIQAMQATLARDSLRQPEEKNKNSVGFWIRRWLTKNADVENGILTLFFLNLVKVDPGMAVYQPAGLLHAYLEGQNVELMANSDNVLRAGLTPKHIDVAELLSISIIEPTDPRDFIIQPAKTATGEIRFVTPFTEFELAELTGAERSIVEWTTAAPEILFCYEGEANIRLADNREEKIKRGESLLLLPGQKIKLNMLNQRARLFKARNL